MYGAVAKKRSSVELYFPAGSGNEQVSREV
jgi:hypothetical protein